MSLCMQLIFLPQERSDIWWRCGGNSVLGNALPNKFTGTCALVKLLLPVTVVKAKAGTRDDAGEQPRPTPGARRKRALPGLDWGEDPTYIDAIRVPQGVPDEYKLADQIAAGLENIPVFSTLIPITPN